MTTHEWGRYVNRNRDNSRGCISNQKGTGGNRCREFYPEIFTYAG
jgi:hypothetical protein